jgi:hypothetical protein
MDHIRVLVTVCQVSIAANMILVTVCHINVPAKTALQLITILPLMMLQVTVATIIYKHVYF